MGPLGQPNPAAQQQFQNLQNGQNFAAPQSNGQGAPFMQSLWNGLSGLGASGQQWYQNMVGQLMNRLHGAQALSQAAGNGSVLPTNPMVPTDDGWSALKKAVDTQMAAQAAAKKIGAANLAKPTAVLAAPAKSKGKK